MKKNDYFIDVSDWQSPDLTPYIEASGTDKTIIKVTESTYFLNNYAQSQADTSNPIGYYHFARFGGNINQAEMEAIYFLNNLPSKEVPYLVLDYEEDASSDVQANTSAILYFMDILALHGYQPIYYSYKPYTLQNVDITQVTAKYPNSLWIGAYADYAVRPTPDGIWDFFPTMDDVRWWQFTSTAITGGLDKSIVLLDNDFETAPQQLTSLTTPTTSKDEKEKNTMKICMRSHSGKQGYIAIVDGRKIPIADIGTVATLKKIGFDEISVHDKDFDNIAQAYSKQHKEKRVQFPLFIVFFSSFISSFLLF